VTLKINLRGYHGNVRKSAVIYSNDPRNPRARITLKGRVRPIIRVEPANVVFRGFPEDLQEKSLELTAEERAFNISEVASRLEGKIAYEVETLEDGRRYRLKVRNLQKEPGRYSGVIGIQTDHPQKPRIAVRVTGFIQGELNVRPSVVSVGRILPDKPTRTGHVIVTSNRNKPFEITEMDYDDRLLEIRSEPVGSAHGGVRLEIVPKLDQVAKGSHKQTLLTFQTDLHSENKHQVRVHIIHR
jgi:hypothetical protein